MKTVALTYTKLKSINAVLRYATALALLATLFFTVLDIFSWSDLSMEKIYSLNKLTVLYDKDGNIINCNYGGTNRTHAAKLTKTVKQAFISTEDVRFYTHNGIDIKRIAGAIIADIKAGQYKQGASTITQQLIKNSHLTGDKLLSRKAQEILLALQLENRMSKDEILALYLDTVYFGAGAYGIEAAAQTYFNTSADKLSLSQASLIAGLVKAPSAYCPYTAPQKAEQRRITVLNQMYENGFITQAELDAARADVPAIAPQKSYTGNSYYTDEVMRSAAALLNKSITEIANGGYKIYTELDTAMQARLEDVMADSANYPADNIQGAAVVLQNSTSAVCACVGGREYTAVLGFNRATSAHRSPGSAIKPLLVYAPALQEKLVTASTLLQDERRAFGTYRPANFNNKYYGSVTVRNALIHSLNIPAVELLQCLGTQKAQKYINAMGINAQDITLAAALGGIKCGVTPLELAQAYRVLYNGCFLPCRFISRIVDENGTTVYKAQCKEARVLSTGTAYIINDILHSAANRWGSAFYNLSNADISLKTGTVACKGGNSDIWAVAYNAEYTSVFWQGCDTMQEAPIPDGITGSKHTSVAAARFFCALYGSSYAPARYVPKDIITVSIDGGELKRSGTVCLSCPLTPQNEACTELFLRGTQPNACAEYYNTPQTVQISVTATAAGTKISLISASDYNRYRIYRANGKCCICVATLHGKKGAALTAFDAGSGWYFAVPEHTVLTVNGKIYTGRASKPMRTG